MTLVRYKNQLPGLLNNFFNADLDPWSTDNYSDMNSTLPAVNIKETEDDFQVSVAVPGFDKNDFNIELDNNILTISSEKEVENEVEGEKYTRREFNYQSFKRTFTLPELVDEEKISAKYENGVLNVVIPKKEEAKPKPARQIKIK
ncbi:MAG TPA: Hsp20/alpha crystallin family protein [Crocinitomix sp.]|nr:Hsp20/alpha crystallin family protein [Crocinitomix sp.]